MNLGTKSGFWMYSQWWWHHVLTEWLWRQNLGHRGEQSACGSVGQGAAHLLHRHPGFHSAHRGAATWGPELVQPWLLSPGHVWEWGWVSALTPGGTTVAPSCDRSAVATPSPAGVHACGDCRLPRKVEVTIKSPLWNKPLGCVPADLPLLWKLQGACSCCWGYWSLFRQRMLGSITEQSRPLGTTMSVGITDSLQAASLFLTISRHLSYANLPNNLFCALILHVLLLKMMWCCWCSIVLPHVLNWTWALPELFLFMVICLTVVLYGRTEGCYLLLHHLIDDTFLGYSDFFKAPRQ